MLSRINRIKKNKEYNYIYKKGKFYSNKYFSVHFVDTRLPDVKVGISVSKKIGNSVMRSRAKRVISEVVRLQIPNMAVKNYIITVKPEIAEASFAVLSKGFDIFLRKCNLIKDTKDV